MDSAAAIGVFDSGLGGLTVARAIREALPAERLVYLGDTARVPYGTRSAQTVIRYARGCGSLLARHGIKALVVACNTVSAVALDVLRVELDVPIVGVVEPGARAAAAVTRSGRVGVLATAGTVASGAYPRALAAIDPRIEVFARAAPLLVPLCEEGWTSGEVPRLVARRYLEPLVACGIDTLVLGCTHYPLLRDTLERELCAIVGAPVPLVDGSRATAESLARLLSERSLAAPPGGCGSLELFVTDLPDRFTEVAARFLGRPVEGLQVRQVDLG
ncbi:MAG: glutamate racemase [Myxococcota bacterium]|nr:glutamate racemase [Myxococcota bacterium]MDW8361851.1 glutamate racemase [Myxococcales bacterium]